MFSGALALRAAPLNFAMAHPMRKRELHSHDLAYGESSPSACWIKRIKGVLMSEKTEPATDQKLKEAKKKGEVPKSQDVTAAANQVALTLCLSAAAMATADQAGKVLILALENGMLVTSNDVMKGFAVEMVLEGLRMSLPFLAVAVITGLLASFGHIGMNVSFEPIAPKFEKLNPAEGIKKLVSPKTFIDFLKTVFKAVVLAAVIYQVTKGLVPLLVGASMQTPVAVSVIAWNAMLKLLIATCLVFVVMAPADFALQKYLFLRDQRMSKDDIKKEHKESEGDPLLKGTRKNLAIELANSDAPRKVPNATVVVTNPTHYAVALYYCAGETPLPVILAKGADEDAALIRRIATESGVPIVSDPPLARALFKVPVDAAIPEPLFEGVVMVLRWVNKLKLMNATTHKPGNTP
jgi:type III secretion protein U